MGESKIIIISRLNSTAEYNASSLDGNDERFVSTLQHLAKKGSKINRFIESNENYDISYTGYCITVLIFNEFVKVSY